MLRTNLNDLDSRIEKLQDKYLEGDIDKGDYTEIKERYMKNKMSLESRIDLLENPKRAEIEPKLNYSISLINNLEKYVLDCPVEVKCKLISLMFPEKITFDGKSHRTEKYNGVLDLIYQQTNELRGKEKAETSENSDVPASVPGAGFELSKYTKILQMKNNR